MRSKVVKLSIDFVKSCRTVLSLVFLLALLQDYLSIILVPLLLKNAFNAFYFEVKSFKIYIYYLLIYYGVYFLSSFLSYTLGYIKVNYTQKNCYLSILKTLFDSTICNSIAFFYDKHSNVITSCMENISANILYIVQTIFSVFLPNLIVSLVYIYHIRGLKIYKFVILWCLFYALILTFFSRRIRKYSKDTIRASNDLSAEMDNILTNIINVKSFSNEVFEVNNIENYIKNEFRNKQKLNNFNIYVDILKISINIVFNLLLFIVLIKNFIAGTIGVDTLFFIFYTVQKVVAQNTTFIKDIITIFETVNITNTHFLELHDKNSIKNYTSNNLILTNAEIDIKSISFKYEDNLPFVFSNFSLQIPSCQKLGIVGYSGAGKTTLINLLLRFYDVNKGEILIDNQNIKTDISQESLRKNISYISQDPLLFNRSIKENILYSNPTATNEEIIEAMKKSNCYNFIKNLENGIDTIVGKNGVRLSGGQRQRIAIARAILKNSKILVLDEATSSLDSITEKEIQSALSDVMANRTIIAIAHRLSTLSIMDRIIVLNGGKIVEDGTKKELLSIKNGLFKKMWTMQRDGILNEYKE